MKTLAILFTCAFIFASPVVGQQTTAESDAKLLSTPKVSYPEQAKAAGISGKVLVRVYIDANGGVTGAEFTKGPGAICRSVSLPSVVAIRESAVAAARQATFSPARKDGVSVASEMIMTFNFGEPPAKSESGNKKMLTVVGEASDSSASILSGGVLNGKAMSLPKPAYPPAARAVRASGAVQVQILIYEDGSVFSAEAVSGHPLLQSASVEAACGGKFTPTLLAGSPVKVSGIITYNFVP